MTEQKKIYRSFNASDAEDLALIRKTLNAPGVFDPCLERFIQGIAVDGSINEKGVSYELGGMRCELPMPLLHSHDWRRPLGWVIDVKRVTNRLEFKAKIANALLPNIDAEWKAIKTGALPAVSISADWFTTPTAVLRSATDPTAPLAWHHPIWHLDEISVCERGANANAQIEYVAEYHRPRNAIALDPYSHRWCKAFIDRRRGVIHYGRPA